VENAVDKLGITSSDFRLNCGAALLAWRRFPVWVVAAWTYARDLLATGLPLVPAPFALKAIDLQLDLGHESQIYDLLIIVVKMYDL